MLPGPSAGVDVPGWQERRQPSGWFDVRTPLRLFRLVGYRFHQPVVVGTQQHGVGQAGLATSPPRPDVVRLAGRGRGCAVGKGAALVPLGERGTQPCGHQPVASTHIQGLTLPTQDDGDQVGVAGEPSGFGGCELFVVASVQQPDASEPVAEALPLERDMHVRASQTVAG